jgi:hypothetical protein
MTSQWQDPPHPRGNGDVDEDALDAGLVRLECVGN